MSSPAANSKPGFLRSILSVVASVVAGSAVMMAVQAANYALLPPPDGLDHNDPGQLQQIVDSLPPAALWLLALSYLLGCLVAGVVLAVGVRSRVMMHALVTGGIFTLLGFVNLTQFPAPLWLAVLTTLTYLPATVVGARVISRRQERRR